MVSYYIYKSNSYGYTLDLCNVLFLPPKHLITLKHGHKLSSLFLPPKASLLSITPSPLFFSMLLYKTTPHNKLTNYMSLQYILVPCNILFSLPKPLTTLKHVHKLSFLFLPPNASLLSITPSPQLYKTIKIWPTYQIQNNKIYYYYSIDKTLQLLKSGYIEINLGFMLNILETHPPPHRRRYKTCFIECTIKLQPEYQHLANDGMSYREGLIVLYH